MDLYAAITAVESSAEFKAFSKEHPKAFFAHAFSMEKPEDEFKWELGYYAPDAKKITVFETSPVNQKPADDAYSKTRIQKLEMKLVKLPPEEAKRIALGFQVKNVPAEHVTKMIVILQCLEKPIYNFTLITFAFNILNIRVDAASGEIVSTEMRSIMSLRRSEK